jgi:hypothetical protein
MGKAITMIKQWDDGELYACEGYSAGSAAVKVVWGYSTGSDTGTHCHSGTFAEAVLGTLDDDLSFIPDTYDASDYGVSIHTRSMIGHPREREGWDSPETETGDVDWAAYTAWISEYVEKVLADAE